jgi:hypothetical protein
MAEWQPLNLTVEGLDALNTHRTRQICAHVTFDSLASRKKKLKDRQLRRVQSLHQAIADLWDELTFEDAQAIFLEWVNRLSWIIENKGGYFIK